MAPIEGSLGMEEEGRDHRVPDCRTGLCPRVSGTLCFPVGHGVNAEWSTAVCLGPSFPLPAPCSPTGVCRVMKCKTGSPGGPAVGVAGVLWDPSLLCVSPGSKGRCSSLRY